MGVGGVRRRTAFNQSDYRRLAGAVAVTALSAVCMMGAPANANATSADRTATHTYLRAAYDVAVAFAHNRSAANAAEHRAGAAIAAECPMVLSGAPGNTQGFTVGTAKLAPRPRGEADLHQHQFSVLTDEFETTLRAEGFKPDAAAFAKFVATVTPLRWSDATIAPLVQEEVSILRVLFEPGLPAAVCSDMRAWVASGYRSLSPGTLAFAAGQEGLVSSVFTLGATNPERALKRYEGPSDRALAKRTEALNSGDILETGGPRDAAFRKALGIEEASPQVNEPKRKIIGHGTARAGGEFKIEVIKSLGHGCPHMISASYTVTSAESGFLSFGSSSLRCLKGRVPKADPEVRCDSGSIEIESTTLAATRDVRLTLSDGTTITSRVIPVPRRYGGPAGAYFQAVKGPSPYPVSLSELDAGGAVLRTVALRAAKHCRQPERRSPPAPIVRNLVQGKTPAGRPFTILAASSVHKGHRTVSFIASGLGSSSIEEGLNTSGGRGAAAKYLPWTLTVGCERQTESIIYGPLKTPGTTVLVATATAPLTPLTEVPVPAALKVPGTLAYAVLTGLPTELVVRDAGGKTLVREDLTARAKQETEFCEGYAEPPA